MDLMAATLIYLLGFKTLHLVGGHMTGVTVPVSNLKGVSPILESSLVFQSLLHRAFKDVTEAAFSPFRYVFPILIWCITDDSSFWKPIYLKKEMHIFLSRIQIILFSNPFFSKLSIHFQNLRGAKHLLFAAIFSSYRILNNSSFLSDMPFLLCYVCSFSIVLASKTCHNAS